MLKTVAMLTLVSGLFLSGCDQLNPPPKPVKKANTTHRTSHRFVQLTLRPDLAFDTQTGQLCKTWEWSPTGSIDPKHPEAQRTYGEFAPTCLSVYTGFMSGEENLPDPIAEVPVS